VDTRKQLFAQHLLSYVPLAARIRRSLEERPDKPMPARPFRDELEEHMSEAYADQTLKAVTNWGRYAEAFTFDEAADQFSLDNPG
jgi:NitT/TauT family transport system ATP-binding protein